jgi:hypothetical protein
MPDSNSLENHVTSKIVYPIGDGCLANTALAARGSLCPLNFYLYKLLVWNMVVSENNAGMIIKGLYLDIRTVSLFSWAGKILAVRQTEKFQ